MATIMRKVLEWSVTYHLPGGGCGLLGHSLCNEFIEVDLVYNLGCIASAHLPSHEVEGVSYFSSFRGVGSDSAVYHLLASASNNSTNEVYPRSLCPPAITMWLLKQSKTAVKNDRAVFIGG